MSLNRRQMLSLSAFSAVVPLLPVHAVGASYPTRPVRVLVGFPSGGGADVLTRIVTEWLQARLGQPFVVENRPGASTNLATEAVVRSPADGYTLLATTTSNLINGALFDDLKYDFGRDIAPVAGVAVQPLVLEVKPDFPAKSVPEFIAYAKANPGKVNMGHFGTGTISHLAAEAFKQAAGIDFVHVPYAGSAPMITDLLGGHIQACFDILPASIGHVKSGALRALTVTTGARSKALPNTSAMGEFLSGYEAITVAGFGAPRGTPDDIVRKLNAEINAGLADPKISARLDDLGSTVLGGSPGDFAALIARETDRWNKVIRHFLRP